MDSDHDNKTITLAHLTEEDEVHMAGTELDPDTVAVINPDGTASTVQYATQGPNGEIFLPVPVPHMTAEGVDGAQTYQIITSGGEPQYMFSTAALATGKNSAEEQAKKRELRLLKNSDAARECRRKKKEYIRCLENRVAILENQNKALIEELKSFKQLHCQQD